MTETAVLSSRRYKIRFPDADSLRASQAAESPLLNVEVINHRRAFIGVSPAEVVGVDVLPEPQEQFAYLSDYGAEIVVDTQYAPGASGEGFELPVGPEAPDAPSLDDVLDLIRARDAWDLTRGAGAVIAVVDSGIAGTRPEFPQAKRIGQWSPAGRDAWTDSFGHGTMCACIATATRAGGGEFDGVAPDASLIACRTSWVDSELATIYDFLGDFAETHGSPVIASNSWGYQSGTPPPTGRPDDFPAALNDALARGVIAVFSAGNYHELAGGVPDECQPTSIWEHKCREDVLTVANSRPDGSMWSTSSRGPGQWFGQAGMDSKPDVNAPTPPNGRVLWGANVASLPDGWGTSGACPQVAGLIALALSHGSKDRDAIFTAIRESSITVGLDASCQGTGRIDCRGALERL
jgi:serine protease AprX